MQIARSLLAARMPHEVVQSLGALRHQGKRGPISAAVLLGGPEIVASLMDVDWTLGCGHATLQCG